MFKMVADEVWIFDAEWVPDPAAGRAAYGLPATLSDNEVIERMWLEGGATDEDPRPYLKTVLCRVVSIAAVIRKRAANSPPQLGLFAVPPPGEEPLAEAILLERFLGGVGRSGPQLVGYNSHGADLVILFSARWPTACGCRNTAAGLPSRGKGRTTSAAAATGTWT